MAGSSIFIMMPIQDPVAASDFTAALCCQHKLV
jgi:hypothetical protein